MKRRRPGRLALHSKPRGKGWEACQALKCWKNGTRADVSLTDRASLAWASVLKIEQTSKNPPKQSPE
jgi:hypothetical protein